MNASLQRLMKLVPPPTNPVAPGSPDAWKQVEELIQTRQPKNYDQAVGLLVDLREVAGKAGRLPQADTRIQAVRDRHASKPSLIRRLDQATRATDH